MLRTWLDVLQYWCETRHVPVVGFMSVSLSFVVEWAFVLLPFFSIVNSHG